LIRRELGHVSGSLAEVLAAVEIVRGNDVRATTLLGGADAIWRSVSWTQYRAVLPDYEKIRVEAQHRLGDSRFQAAYAAGLAMSLDEVADFALGVLVPKSAGLTKRAAPAQTALTRREMEVARLVADGASNAQTAAQLFISERTVESHVTNIFNKLGVNSRVQVARWIAGVEPVVR
jgi:non-specific serine/threonine protein kinase